MESTVHCVHVSGNFPLKLVPHSSIPKPAIINAWKVWTVLYMAVSKRASERAVRTKRTSERCERTSERTSERSSPYVPILDWLDHRAKGGEMVNSRYDQINNEPNPFSNPKYQKPSL